MYQIRKGDKYVTLLNPAEKADKYVTEIKSGCRLTNDGQIKTDKYGSALGLDKQQRAYRSGYLDARKDSAKCYKANKKRKK